MSGYPGDGYRMSNYGAKNLTPQEKVGRWKEYTKTEARMHKNHIAVKGDGSSSFPGVKEYSEEELQNPGSFFSETDIKHNVSTTYDRLFRIDYDYNSKIHRDDRQHTVGLDIPSEEMKRSIPVRSSTDYGRRVEQPLEMPTRKYRRVDRVVKGFYRTRSTGIPSGSG